MLAASDPVTLCRRAVCRMLDQTQCASARAQNRELQSLLERSASCSTQVVSEGNNRRQGLRPTARGYSQADLHLRLSLMFGFHGNTTIDLGGLSESRTCRPHAIVVRGRSHELGASIQAMLFKGQLSSYIVQIWYRPRISSSMRDQHPSTSNLQIVNRSITPHQIVQSLPHLKQTTYHDLLNFSFMNSLTCLFALISLVGRLKTDRPSKLRALDMAT